MLKHNLKIIFRNFSRHKNVFFINLAGLSSGLACVLFIYLWVNDELNIDKFHKNDSRLYQVLVNHHNTDNCVTLEGTPDLLAETIADEIPEIEYAVAVVPPSVLGNAVISTGNKKIKASGQFAGNDFFKIFSYKIVSGEFSPLNKNSVIISRQLANRLFNNTKNVIGKTVEWQYVNMNGNYVVSGIYEDISSASSAQFDFILPYEAWKDFSKNIGRPIGWFNFCPFTYFTLKDNSSIEELNKKLEGFVKGKNEQSNVTLITRKYSDAYLYGKYENGMLTGGRIEYVRIFSAVAVFVLIIACINFMNLSTAKAGSRLKEIGVKKAIGADRKSLILQYMGESITLALLSMLLAIILVELFMPWFNQITAKRLSFQPDLTMSFSFILIALLTGILSGSYPALYLSGFNPVKVLKGKVPGSARELFARKGLVVFQFSLSIIFIVSLIIIYNQVKYIHTKNPGFEKDNIIYFEKEGVAGVNTESFLSQIKEIPGVINASYISNSLVGSHNSTGGVYWEGKSPEDIIYFEEVYVGYDMLETLGINMKEGRTFSEKFGNEKSKIIFNETAVKTMGLKNPVGKTVRHYTGDMEIIGVAKDFHFESLHEPVKPLLFRVEPGYSLKYMVRIQFGKERSTIERIKNFYETYNAGYSFDFKFLDEDYQAQYSSETRVNELSKYFAVLAIIISCLGLLGLSAFSTERRIKEISIRKVLGAGQGELILLLSKEFIWLVLISFVVASPVAWFITRNWLDSFVYRIDINWWFFAAAGFIALVIALITVGFQAIKAATANPVESLKYE